MACLENFDELESKIKNVIERYQNKKQFANFNKKIDYLFNLIINLLSLRVLASKNNELYIESIINDYCERLIKKMSLKYYDPDHQEHMLCVMYEIIKKFKDLKGMNYWTIYAGSNAKTEKRINIAIDFARLLKIYMNILCNDKDVYLDLQMIFMNHYLTMIDGIKCYSSRSELFKEMCEEFKPYIINNKKRNK